MTTKVHPRPLVAVDVVAAAVLESELQLLLIRRGIPPLQESLALPGGFVRVGDGVVDQGESLKDAARRELVEETRVDVDVNDLVCVKAFGAPHRDPRTRVISVAFAVAVRPEVAAFIRAGTDAASVRWFAVRDLDKVTLAFDHNEIARACLARLRRDVDVFLPRLAPRVFSLAELRAAHDAVVGGRSDPGNFRRGFVKDVDAGRIVPAPGQREAGKRPAAVWRFAA